MGSKKEKIRKLLLKELEEDDEIFFVLVPALYSCLYEEKRPVHTSSLLGAKKVKEILEGHESWCRVEFRMEPEIFKAISDFPLPFLILAYPFSTNPQDMVASSVDNKEDTEPTTSACSEKKGEGSRRKRKQSQLALVLEDYLDYRKQQTTILVEDMNKTPKEHKTKDKFSVANCVTALEAMEELTDLEKAKALTLFKCQLNREIFYQYQDYKCSSLLVEE